MDKTRARQLYELANRLSKIDESSLSPSQVIERKRMITMLQGELSNHKEVKENMENNPVANAITRRIMMQRPDLLKHGPQAVMQAIDDVADFVGEVEEIGSSDVSAWVKQVEQALDKYELTDTQWKVIQTAFKNN